MARPPAKPRFAGRGKRTWRHAEYRGWKLRAIQLEAEDDWLAHVRPPEGHRLHTPGMIGWGTICSSQAEAEKWCEDRVEEIESGESLNKTEPTA